MKQNRKMEEGKVWLQEFSSYTWTSDRKCSAPQVSRGYRCTLTCRRAAWPGRCYYDCRGRDAAGWFERG